MAKTKAETIEPVEDVEEIGPMEMIASLEEDLAVARRALRKITRIQPHALPGGPSNKWFGLKGMKAFLHAQEIAYGAYYTMENKVNE